MVKAHFPSIIESPDRRTASSSPCRSSPMPGPLLPQGPARQVRRHGAQDLGGAGRRPPRLVMDGERAAGNKDIWGFVFQGNAYEGLTCDALEWVKSNGGGQIVEPDGTISVNNPKAAAAIDDGQELGQHHLAPGRARLSGRRERAASGRPAMRSSCATGPMPMRSATAPTRQIKGKFDVTPLPVGPATAPRSAATLGGWNLAVPSTRRTRTRRSSWPCSSPRPELQKDRAIAALAPADDQALYDDPDIAKAQPIIPRWKDVFLNAVPRPSAPTKVKYNEVSTSSGPPCTRRCPATATAADNLEQLEAEPDRAQGRRLVAPLRRGGGPRRPCQG